MNLPFSLCSEGLLGIDIQLWGILPRVSRDARLIAVGIPGSLIPNCKYLISVMKAGTVTSSMIRPPLAILLRSRQHTAHGFRSSPCCRSWSHSLQVLSATDWALGPTFGLLLAKDQQAHRVIVPAMPETVSTGSCSTIGLASARRVVLPGTVVGRWGGRVQHRCPQLE